MIRKIGILLVATLIGRFTDTLLAQNFVPTPVEKSTEQVRVNGALFYVHHVQKGQTLYSVSKAYDLSIDEILDSNPSAKEGLKSNTILYIPIKTPISVEPSTPRSEEPLSEIVVDTKKYKKHTVRWFENIYDISQKYKVSVEAIAQLNNLGEEIVLKKRQVLLIPDKEYIMELNRRKRGELLTTPKKDLPISFHSDSEVVEKIDTLNTLNKVDGVDTIPSVYRQNLERSKIITLLLPFGTHKGADGANPNMMDFYAGAMVALYDFQKESGDRSYKLNVIDISDYPTNSSLISSGVLDNSEIVIGPIYGQNIAPIAKWGEANHIPVVSPLDPKSSYLAQNNGFLFQYPPANESTMERVLNQVLSDVKERGEAPYIIYEKGTNNSQLVRNSIDFLVTNGVTIDTLSYSILEGRGIDAVMARQLDTATINSVMVLSESEAFVSDVLRNLLLVKGGNSKIGIKLYGTPKWGSFEIVELSNLHDLNTHLALQYYIDYSSPQVKSFIENYNYTFHTDPSQYAYQGYDILYFFLNALHEWGREFPIYIEGYQKNLLQSNVRFEKIGSGSGFINKGVKSITYTPGWLIKPW